MKWDIDGIALDFSDLDFIKDNYNTHKEVFLAKMEMIIPCCTLKAVLVFGVALTWSTNRAGISATPYQMVNYVDPRSIALLP